MASKSTVNILNHPVGNTLKMKSRIKLLIPAKPGTKITKFANDKEPEAIGVLAKKARARYIEAIKASIVQFEMDGMSKLRKNCDLYDAVDQLRDLQDQIGTLVQKYTPKWPNINKISRNCPKCNKADPHYDVFRPTPYHICYSCHLTWWYCSYHEVVVKVDSKDAIPKYDKIRDHTVCCKCGL